MLTVAPLPPVADRTPIWHADARWSHSDFDAGLTV